MNKDIDLKTLDTIMDYEIAKEEDNLSVNDVSQYPKIEGLEIPKEKVVK